MKYHRSRDMESIQPVLDIYYMMDTAAFKLQVNAGALLGGFWVFF